MRFGLILAGVTVGTLILIFGFYRLFLYSPSPPKASTAPRVSNNQLNGDGALPSSGPTEATPAASRVGSPIPSVRRLTTIGTLTVLKDNTSSLPSSGVGSANISGSLSFSGSAPSGTSVVIVARPSGTNEPFKTVVSGVTASNGASWTWTTSVSGKTYDMVAILKGSSGGVDTDYAMSQTYVTASPAYNQIFAVNAAGSPPAPTGTITVTCPSKNSNNVWNATVNFPTVSDAASYKLQLGTTSGGIETANTTQSVQSGTNQTLGASLADSVVYYAQYSIATVAYPTEYQYSEFSQPQTIKCPN